MNLYEINNYLVVAQDEVAARMIVGDYGDLPDPDAVARLVPWSRTTQWSVTGCGEYLTVGENGEATDDIGGEDEPDSVTYQQVYDYYRSRGGKFPGVLGMAEYC